MERQRTLEERRLQNELNIMSHKYDSLSSAFDRLSTDYTLLLKQHMDMQDLFDEMLKYKAKDMVQVVMAMRG